jgi:hypothetical protein
MATFHSMSQAAILKVLNSQGLIANDLYYSTDQGNLYLACTNTDGSVGIAETGMILTGAIALGFNGNATSLGGAPIVGTPTAGQTLVFNGTNWVPQTAATTTPNIVNVSADYSTKITDDVLIVNPASPLTITLTTDGIVAGKLYEVTVLDTGSAQILVASQHGEQIQNQDEDVALYNGDALGFFWTGSEFILQ